MFSKYLKLYLSKLPFIIFAFIILYSPYELNAKVTGRCDNCHTMHNSQNGNSYNNGPNQNLLVNVSGLSSDICVGCHSSSTGKTIIEAGSSKVPIVYNTGGPTEQYLAGGNFYWAAQGDDSKGHNVYGVAGQDAVLGSAPGRNPAGCANSCHDTLAVAPSNENYYRGGCQGCHVFTYHHEDNGVYRFLKGHGVPGLQLTLEKKNITTNTDYVKGKEDDDWEQEISVDHNWYKGSNAAYNSNGSGLKNLNTISSFCSGCHSVFHGPYNSTEKSGMGGGAADDAYPGSPWRRHPADIKLPDTGEYHNYDPSDPAKYSAMAPVAWTEPSAPTRAGAVVMCLSCHRAHGSPYSDMLRWKYNENADSDCKAGTDNNNCGCFVCHTEKDGS